MMRAASNSMLMPTAAPPGPAYWGLTFTAEEAGSTIAMEAVPNNVSTPPPAVSLETSTDGETWTPFTVGTTVITLAKVGDRVFFRAGDGGTGGDGVNLEFAVDVAGYNKFVMSGTIAASGDISSILDRSGTVLSFARRSYVFVSLFRDCTALRTAPELPATTLGNDCYYYMFIGCTALTTAPELPATTLASYCYNGMFRRCTALKTAPALPATTLVGFCYYYMFYGCTALTTAPELPATTLANSCYRGMFYGCTALTTAPKLSAEAFVTACYRELFRSCSALADITVAFQSWGSISSAFTNWVLDVAASGTFRCPAALGTDETIARGANRCPAGWTVINI